MITENLDKTFTVREILEEASEYGRGVCELIGRLLLDCGGVGEGTGENALEVAEQLGISAGWLLQRKGKSMDALEKALRAATKELEEEHEFFFEETGEDEMVAVLKKHIRPLVDSEKYKAMRIAELKAEISALESLGEHKPSNAEITGRPTA